MKKYLLVATAFLTGGWSVFATSIAPSGTALVSLPAATFGGTGIANDKVEVTTITTPRQDTITLGLTATPRYFNPALGNDGFGTFTATPGFNNGLGSPAHTLGPTWNFDFYINVVDNSGAGTTSTSGTIQDSWNLGFVSGIAYDPNASGLYGLQLEQINADGVVVASTAINVNVGSVPDASSTATLLGLGFVGLAFAGYRHNRLALARAK
jgi:hypothetical protein